MADGKLVFPVKFDLEAAVKEASGDADRVLKRLGTMINSRPLKLGIEIEQPKGGWDKKLGDYGKGSINAMRKEMAKLIEQWNKLSEAQRITDQKSGAFTADAMKIINRYSQLVTASESYARSLEQIASAAKKAADAEIRTNQKAQAELEKRKAKSQALVDMLKNEENSVTSLTARLNFYTKQMNSADKGSKKWAYNSQMVQQLREQLDKLNLSQKKVTDNDVKVTEKRLQERARIKSALLQEENSIDRVNAKLKIWHGIMNRSVEGSGQFAYAAKEIVRLEEKLDNLKRKQMEITSKPISIMPESTLTDLTAKIQAYQDLMRRSDFGSKEFRDAMNAASSLTTKLEQMNAEVAKTEKLRLFREALKAASDTLEGLNTRLSAWQSKIQTEKIGSDGWNVAANMIAKYNRELEIATQYMQDFQQKSFQGLGESWTKSKVEEVQRYREQIRLLSEQFNSLNAQGLAYDKKGNLTDSAKNILTQRAEETKKLSDTLRTADDAQKQHNEDLRRYEEEHKKATEAARKALEQWKATRQMLQSNEERLVNLNAKLQFYQSLIQKQQVGSEAWNKTAMEVRRLSEELQRANQYLNDFQSKAFRGLSTNFTAQQTEAVQNLRRQIDDIDKQFNRLYQSGRATKADGTYTDSVNAMLKERMRLTEEINRMMKTAADAQLEREKEINRLIERRNAKNKEQQAAYNKARQAGLEQYRILKNQEKTISEISAKLQLQRQRLNNANMDSAKFKKIAAEVERLTRKLENAQRKVAELTGQSSSSAKTRTRNIQNVNQEYAKQLTYLDRLVRRMAVYGSIGMLGNFVRNVREVTAQFELQRVSLGAILQDQTKANQLFSEIKSFALKSPVSILDLTKYTKQLAAYKIGYDELFETTKKLTDVSVGLGVSMDRVVLAYGQVRATGHLRASEIRQFTEMGVPIVEELAAKLSKMNGELVTAADVMDMVSKRAIGFDMVKEVFDDMTSAGGIFYNMQEKQGNTLYGLWAKLGDAASVMYDEIGRTGAVNSVMKGLIQLATDLMKNWGLVAAELFVVGTAIGIVVRRNQINATTTSLQAAALNKVRNAGMAYNAILAEEAKLLKVGTAAQLQSVAARKANAKAALDAAIAERTAANATGFWTRSVEKLKAAFMGNWMTILITAAAAIGVAIAGAVEKATRLKRALNEIEAETIRLQTQSVGRFEHLAEAAVNAADGSRKQRDALAELSRTYGEILPQDALKLENLRQMNHSYGELTATLREYIATQQMQKGLSEISENYGAEINKSSKKLIDGLVSEMKIGRDVAANIVGEMQRDFQEKLEKGERDTRTITQRMIAAARKYGVEMSNLQAANAGSPWYDLIWASDKYLVEFYNALGDLDRESADFENRMKGMAGASYEFQKAIEETKKKISDLTLTNPDGSAINENTLLGQQVKANETMKVVADMIKSDTSIENAIKDKETEWNEDWIHLVASVDPDNLMEITTVNFDAIIKALNAKYPQIADKIRQIQKEWGNVAPTNPTAVQIRQKLLDVADSFGVSIDKMKKYLWDGSGSVDDYLKKLKEQQETLKARLKEKEQTLLNMGVISKWWNKLLGKDIEAEVEQMKKEIEALDKLVPFTEGYTVQKKKKSGGRKSDPRLQNLKEEISLVQKLYQEYKQLDKQEGATKATADMNRMAKDTIAMLSKKYGIGLPKTANDVVSALEILYGKMEQLPRKAFPSLDKDLEELRWTIEKVGIDDSQKNIEAELKKLADRISRTKMAKEFYDKILSQTGDAELAINLTTSIYGEDGESLDKQIQEQIRAIVGSTSATLDMGVFFPDDSLDPKKLREFAEAQKDALGGMESKAYQELIKLSDNAEKDFAKTIEGWMKATEKAKTYGDKLADVYRKTATEIEAIQKKMDSGQLDKGIGSDLIAGFKRKEAEEVAKLQYEAFKDSPMYVQMFDDLDNASTRMLGNMRNRLIAMQGEWKNLDPTQLKELQGRLNEIDTQLARRNPFKTIADGIRDYRGLGKAGDGLGNKSEKGAEKALDAAAKARLEAEREYLAVLDDEKSTQEEIAAAKLKFDNAAANEDAAAKALENWKKVKDAIGLSSNELMQMLNWAGDIAGAVADISEALGADEEDVQYWNDVASALGEISGGIQDIVSAAMSGNVVGVISSTLTAIPKMFVGFVNLFNANRIRKANKEIRRQQELLEQLEYTYSRVQKAAEKAFGADYIRNYNQELQNLEAQAEAYQKQAEAEKSKGKKTDKEKLKEYENSYRDTMDEIADMQTQLVEKFTGTNRQDVARQMAQSWIDARVSMSDTFAAIKGDYSEMIKNMLVEGAAARVIENALTPMWDKMDAMLKDNNIDGAIDSLVGGMDDALNAANNGMEVLWKALEARGYDMKQLIGEADESYTGIAKNVAGATSEEINANTAALNTQNYYLSHVPAIGENVAAIRMILQGGSATVSGGSAGPAKTIDYTDLLTAANQHLASLPRMERHLSDIYTLLNRVVVYEKGRFVVNSSLKG